MRFLAILALALALLVPGHRACATSLRVAPAMLDLPATAKVAALTLRNGGRAPAHYQIRVFSWSQHNGAETLAPTRDVVVSPPITKIDPGRDYVVRLVRLGRQPVTREESYRVLVDELPVPGQRADRTVTFLLRYSIPVFFSPGGGRAAALDWRVQRNGSHVTLTAANPGARRVKVTNLRLRDRRGREMVLAPGLAGYVLAGARRSWRFEGAKIRGLASGSTHLLFKTELEAEDVQVALPGGG